MSQDKELEEYRQLMPVPTSFADGFSLKSVIGSIFIGLVMMPASMYLSFLAGQSLGPAAQWVTVILFVELARRSFTTLKRPEIFILFYMTGAAVANPFGGFLWTQFFVQSDAAKAYGIAPYIPAWVAPGPDVLALRTFFHKAWLLPILLVIGQNLLSRIDQFGLGYVLFRLTSDVEKLPFPMAPVGASGITALAESSAGEATWRWRVFSIGGMIGLLFGAIYIGVPSISSTILHHPIQPLPIPFIDLTLNTQSVLPAVPVAITPDLGNVLIGMVLPFSAVLGSFIGMLVTWIVNPILYHHGQLPSWQPGMSGIDTNFATTLDAYMSIGIGLSLAIAVVSFYTVYRSLRQHRDRVAIVPLATPAQGPPFPLDYFTPTHSDSFWRRLTHPPAGRGDIPLWAGIAIYLFSTTCYIAATWYLLEGLFPLWILLAYGFVYTPLISYVAARMEGIAGQWVDIPMVREATFILSNRLGHYHGVGIWYAPIPISNYAGSVLSFRTMELTGTKFTSVIKAEFVIFPIVILASILFSQYLWRSAPIPSTIYPYINQMWDLQARNEALKMSSTLGASSPFFDALKWQYVVGAAGIGTLTYSALASFGAPIMLCFGLVRGLGSGLAAGLIPQMVGALLGRYYFRKRFGLQWSQYAPVLLAGFSSGMGLISMLSLACVLISNSVYHLAY